MRSSSAKTKSASNTSSKAHAAQAAGQDGQDVHAGKQAPLVSRAVKAIAKSLVRLETETEEEAKLRIYEDFCGMVDSMGAAPMIECLQQVAKTSEAPTIRLATEVIRKACMRCEGTAFGKLYDAHMMMVPLVLRGPVPARFPTVIPEQSMHLVHAYLKEVLRRRSPIGDATHPLPVSFLYTMGEFADEKLTKMHEILRRSFAGVASHPTMDTAPDHVCTEPEKLDENRFDDELHDLTIAKLGMSAWSDRGIDRAADKRAIEKLHVGDWTTFRLMPVVLLVPNGETPPTLSDFDADGSVLGSILSMASIPLTDRTAKSKTIENEDLSVTITPVGIYTTEKGPQAARMLIGRSRVFTDLVRVQHTVQEGTPAYLSYSPPDHVLTIVYTDGANGLNNTMILEPGIKAQIFIETLARDLQATGIPVQVDLGDSMIRQGFMPTLTLH